MKFRDLNKRQKLKLWGTFVTYITVAIIFLVLTCGSLIIEKAECREGWDSYLKDSPEQQHMVEELSQNAVKVMVGTYVENIKEMNLKSSNFRIQFMVWFDWEGSEELDIASNFRIYKGSMNSKNVIDEVHEGNKHYQLVNVDATISKSYDTKRFPLESHQLRFYVESTDPVSEVLFEPDYENSGINKNISLSGYKFMRYNIGAVSYKYDSNHGNPQIKGSEVTSEIVTAFEINRASLGLYFRCFVALLGTTTWVLIVMYIASHHHVDPLGMVPAALFGTVSNIMIGANLLPDALEMGLIEYVNLWGVFVIIAVAIAIINMNSIRSKEKDKDFASLYGKTLFYTTVIFVIVGHLALPLSAYIF